jgi:hypothetical protein
LLHLSDLNLEVHQDDLALTLDEILNSRQDRVRVPRGGGHTGKPHGGPPPGVVMVHLGGADAEPVLRPLDQALDQAALVLQAAGAWQAQLGTGDADDDRPLLL